MPGRLRAVSLRALLLISLAVVGIVPQVTLWSNDHDIMEAVARTFALQAAGLSSSVPAPRT
jgi:hypothetical protein